MCVYIFALNEKKKMTINRQMGENDRMWLGSGAPRNNGATDIFKPYFGRKNSYQLILEFGKPLTSETPSRDLFIEHFSYCDQSSVSIQPVIRCDSRRHFYFLHR